MQWSQVPTVIYFSGPGAGKNFEKLLTLWFGGSIFFKRVILGDRRVMEKVLASARGFSYICSPIAGIAQLVERNLAKVDVAGSSPVSRSVPNPVRGKGHPTILQAIGLADSLPL